MTVIDLCKAGRNYLSTQAEREGYRTRILKAQKTGKSHFKA
jgi:hypothetical protein